MKSFSIFNPVISFRRPIAFAIAGIAVVLVGACSGDPAGPSSDVKVGVITIDSGPMLLERGTHKTLTATVRDTRGEVISVPLVWRSSDESVATFQADRRLLARDTGVTVITASSLGVTSQGIGVRVVWLGPAKVAAFDWTAPTAVSPGATIRDSIRIAVTNRDGYLVPNARVAFTVTSGHGTVTPAIDTTGPNGIAAAKWTAGMDIGPNTVKATVIDDDGQPVAWVADNPVTFSVTAYQALKVVDGDAQTALLLAPLPTAPKVRLVDAQGNPRAGIPVTFTASDGGRVAAPNVPTDADGVASPGTWTLGDAAGDETLTASVESATLVLHATATGTAVHYPASSISAGGAISCALTQLSAAQCWGRQPLVGDGSIVDRSVPTDVQGGLTFTTLSPGATHVCGVSSDGAIYCWGINALVDTTGKLLHAAIPTKLPSDITWSRVAAGTAHNCAVATDQTPYCWGDDTYGQLGDGSNTTRFVPAPVAGGFKFTDIVSTSYTSCGLASTGAAYCWGNNQNGEIGDGSTAPRNSPTAVSGGITFQSIASGSFMSCGLTSGGKVYCWGSLPGVTAAQTTPRTYPDAPLFTTLTVGAQHACALTADGSAYCWGDNNGGQLGDSTTTTRADPTAVAGNLKFSAISAGSGHTCAITTAGEVACWGTNQAGELGDAVLTTRLTPRLIVTEVKP